MVVAARRQADDAGVGDHDVEATEFRESGGDDGIDGVMIAHVGLTSDDPAAGVLDEFDRLLQIRRPSVRVVDRVDVGTDVQRDDVATVAGQPYGMRATLTPRGPGDERDPIVQSTHMFAPTFSARQHWIHQHRCAVGRDRPTATTALKLWQCDVIRQ